MHVQANKTADMEKEAEYAALREIDSALAQIASKYDGYPFVCPPTACQSNPVCVVSRESGPAARCGLVARGHGPLPGRGVYQVLGPSLAGDLGPLCHSIRLASLLVHAASCLTSLASAGYTTQSRYHPVCLVRAFLSF
jgi:hypothetical protein